MINLADFCSLISQCEILKLTVLQGYEIIYIERFDPTINYLEYPLHQYNIVTFYSHYDENEKKSKIIAYASYAGEDKNAEKG